MTEPGEFYVVKGRIRVVTAIRGDLTYWRPATPAELESLLAERVALQEALRAAEDVVAAGRTAIEMPPKDAVHGRRVLRVALERFDALPSADEEAR